MIENGLRTLSAWICSFVYQVIAWVYELFINISRVEILSSDDIQPIYERITLILSIIMVFYITFEFVKFVVQPDGIVDKEKGAPKTVLKMIVVVALIAFVPTIFSLSYKVQNTIFDNQLFSKIILGKQDVDMETFGRDFSANVLSMFYYVDEDIEWDNQNKGEKCGDLECKQIVSLNNEYLRQHGKLPYLTMGLEEKAKAKEEKTGENVETYKIYFNGIFAVGVGAFVAYMLILYCIDAGVRVAQMTFLQIIAPIPIIGYLSPKKDGIFQKWLKQCITTYLDLFLRVGIIYFVLLVCQILSKSFSDGTIMENATNATGTMKIFMFIAILMGLLLFAKKAPKMLQELFPRTGAASGNFGLKGKERLEPTIGAVKGVGKGIGKTYRAGRRTAGAVSGAAMGLASAYKHRKDINSNNKNRLTKGFATAYSAAKAAAAGAKAGGSKGGGIKKANAAARQSIQKDVSIADKGGTAFGHDMFGGKYQQISVDNQRKIGDLQARQKAKDTVSSAVKEMKVMKTANSYKADWDQKGFGDASARNAAMKDIEKASRVYSVGKRDATAEQNFKDSIKTALDKVYTEAADLEKYIKLNNINPDTLPPEQKKLLKEREDTLNNIYSNLEIGSVNWDTVQNEIKEAKRVSVGQKFAGKDKDGKPIIEEVRTSTNAEDEQKYLEDFAKSIGDVADAAKEEEGKIKYAADTRRATANANSDAPGGKK